MSDKTNKYDLPEPPKPWPEFPLKWHRNRYRKKFRGQYHYFSADPIKSYDEWKTIENAAERGETVATTNRRHTLADARDVFLTRQSKRQELGKVSESQFVKYRKELTVELAKVVPMKTPLSRFADHRYAPKLFVAIHDAAIARGLNAAVKHIQYVRAMLDYVALPKGGLLMPPPFYGDDFDLPTGDEITKQRNASRGYGSDPIWTMDEAKQIIAAAKAHDTHLYAQLVLMVLGGYTSADVAALPLQAINRKLKMIIFPRVKTGQERLCPLIPELAVALDASLSNRPAPASEEHSHLMFLTRRGTPVCRTVATYDDTNRPKRVVRNDVLGQNLDRLVRSMDLETLRAAAKKNKTSEPVLLGRPGLGQSTFRSLNYSAGVTAGVDKDYLAVLRGRQFQEKKIEMYYLRGDHRVELEKLVSHIAKQFGITADPVKFTQSHRRKDLKRRSPRRRSGRRAARPSV